MVSLPVAHIKAERVSDEQVQDILDAVTQEGALTPSSNITVRSQSLMKIGKWVSFACFAASNVTNSNWGSILVGTMPEGFRPAQTMTGIAIANNNPGYVYVHPDGRGTVEALTSASRELSFFLPLFQAA